MLKEAAAVIQSHQYKVEPHITKVAWLLQQERHAKGDGHVAAGTTDKASNPVLVLTAVKETQVPISPPLKPPPKYRMPTALYYSSVQGTGIVTRHQAKQKRMFEENYLKKVLGIDQDDYIPDAYKLCNMIEPANLPSPGVRKAGSEGLVMAVSSHRKARELSTSRKLKHGSKQSHGSNSSARKQRIHQNRLLVDVASLLHTDASRLLGKKHSTAKAKISSSEGIKSDDIVARQNKKQRAHMLSPGTKNSKPDNKVFKVSSQVVVYTSRMSIGAPIYFVR